MKNSVNKTNGTGPVRRFPFINSGNKNRGKNGAGEQGKPNFAGNLVTTLLIFILLISLYSFIVEERGKQDIIPLSELVADIRTGAVKEVFVEGEDIQILYRDGAEKKSKKELESSFSETLVNHGVTTESLNTIAITVRNPNGVLYWVFNLMPFLIPAFFIIFFLWFLSRQVKGAGMQAFTFGQSRARFVDPKDKRQRVLFKDVAGVKEAKEELLEIVDFLKNPKKFLDIGARIPKGVLLMGPPGSGKTLLARAVSGEAGVPFFSVSGSEFIEMFVGVGSARVKDTFRLAKKAAPAIIFIDEIDAVGRVRGAGLGGGNDEREQTLNQILVEMDGFEPNEKVVVLAASNRADVLDPALLRPGRFDRRVMLDLPDRDDREAILAIHGVGKPLGEDVNLKIIAERTPGFSGADLQNLMNEGAILAAREGRKQLAQFDLIRSIEKVMLGPERKSHLMTKREKDTVAYHEAGHALVASVLPNADPVHKVSIISRGHAGGYTLKLPIEEKRLKSRQEFLDDIAVGLGGFTAEKMIFGDVTTGPSNDIQVLTALARSMVTRFGMSDALGPMALEEGNGHMLYGYYPGSKEYSEEVSAKIDAEVSKIIEEAHKRAIMVLTEHRVALDAIAAYLVEHESVERDDFEKLLIAHGIMPKKRKEEKAAAGEG